MATNTIGPADYLPNGGDLPAADTSHTWADSTVQNQQHLNETADRLEDRSHETFTPGDSGNYELEVQLAEIQAQLHHSTDFLQQQRLSKEAEAIAAQIVSGQGREAQTQKEFNEQYDQESATQIIRDQYGEEYMNETINWAAQNLSREVCEDLNKAFEGDGLAAQEAFQTLQTLREEGVSTTTEHTQLSTFEVSALESSFGQLGADLAVINMALPTGAINKSQAVRDITSNPALMKTAIAAAKAGLISLSV